MSRILFLFLIFSLGFITSDKDKIEWSEDYKLSWSDFKGEPNRSSGYVASTNSGISFSYSYGFKYDELVLDFEVKSNFYPNLSWYLPSIVTENTLKHEQTHFDISEIHARILRKRISETQFSKQVETEIGSLYNQVEIERRAMQNQFDEETDHSNIRDKEIAWEEFVEQQLKDLDDWK
jgi:replication initiation and membrane attachment protein DnaB